MIQICTNPKCRNVLGTHLYSGSYGLYCSFDCFKIGEEYWGNRQEHSARQLDFFEGDDLDSCTCPKCKPSRYNKGTDDIGW